MENLQCRKTMQESGKGREGYRGARGGTLRLNSRLSSTLQFAFIMDLFYQRDITLVLLTPIPLPLEVAPALTKSF